MENSTLIHNVTSDEITDLFEGLQKQITELQKGFEPKQPTEYLTRNEVAEMFKCDLSTIHNWCVKQKLKPYGIGSRVYFKRSEIEASLIPLNQKGGKNG